MLNGTRAQVTLATRLYPSCAASFDRAGAAKVFSELDPFLLFC